MNPRTQPSLTIRRTTALAALAVAGALVLGACTDEATDDRGIDAESYFRDYDESSDDYAYSSPNVTAVEEEGQAEPGLPDVPSLTEDNTFVDPGTSGFVETGADPLSTFALDVDSGSLGVARTLLEEGVRPPAASIRVEEWVNAPDFTDGYADQAPDGADLGVSTESVDAPGLDDDTQLVRVGVAAREIVAGERPRVNVTLVVDRSGSMDIRDRLGLVQSSLALLADRLADDDTISVVSFEDQARPILEPTPVRETGRILAAIEELEPGGSTNLEAGLRVGYEQARASFDDDAVNLVVLASDGVANVGATGPGSITERIAEEGADGIHLVTVGYGMGNYNDHLMEQLADLGDGFYAYVDTYAEAERLFGEDLTTTLTPVAGEARTQVEFDPELVTAYRLVGYDNRAIADEDFTDMSVDAGELGAGHRATALYEVQLAEGVDPGTPIGDATVQWTSMESGDTERAEVALLAADPEAVGSPGLALSATVADLAQALKGADPVAGRDLDLDTLRDRAAALDDDGVEGADDLLDLIDLALAAR